MSKIVDILIGLPVDQRTQFIGLFYCNPVYLSIVYLVLFLLKYVITKICAPKKVENVKSSPFILIFNGFLFGSYGIFLLVGLHCVDFGLLLFNCSLPETISIEVKPNLSVFTFMALHYGMIIRFFEPVLYQITGQPCPYSKVDQIEQAAMHFLGILAARYYCYNYLALAPLLHALRSLVFYGKQTLVSTGYEEMLPGSKWNKLITNLSMLEKVLPILHGLWGIFRESCSHIKPLIELEICGPLILMLILLFSKIKHENIDKIA